MERFATRPGFHIKIRNFHPDAEFKDLVGATYVSATDHVNNFQLWENTNMRNI